MLYRECHLRRVSAYLLIVICISVLMSACGQSTTSLIAKGEENLKKRKFHDALMQFKAAAESDSDLAAAHWGLARSYEHLGQFSETLEELRRTVELDDKNLDAKSKLGNYFLLVQPPMISESEKLKDEILAADPTFVEGQILTASIMAAQGQPDGDVVAVVNKAIQQDPKRIESYISLQRLYMTRENAADAEAAIKRGIAAAPESVPGYVEYGRFLMYSSRDAEAEEQFNKALAADPSNIEARESLADFYVTSRQMEKAEQAYLELVSIQENSPESRLVLAEFYYAASRPDEAIAALNEILTTSPEYALARYRLAKIHLERRESEAVNKQLAELFRVNDDDIEARMIRARLSIQEGKSDEAVKDLEEILKKQPSGREPLFWMAQARLNLGQVDQSNAFLSDLERYHPHFLKPGLIKIQSAFNLGQPQNAWKLANELLDKAVAAIPSADFDARAILDIKVRSLTSRGLASLELGKVGDAKNDLQEVVKLSPRSGAAMVNLAKAFTAERNNQAALEMYQRALEADGQNFDAVTGYVDLAIKAGFHDKAHAMLDNTGAPNAARPSMLAGLQYLRSLVFTAQNNAAEAERALAAAIELDPNYLPAYSAYASLLARTNRGAEAADQYKRVVEKRPSASAYTMLGILEESRGGRSEAEKAYRRALETSPDSPIAANNLAWLIAESNGNLDEALQLANAAVSKGQTNAGFYDTLGYVYLKKGLASPAAEQFKKAVAMEESRGGTAGAAYRVRLGMALAKAGDRESARREVEISLRNTAQLSSRELQEAKGLLAAL